MALVAEPVTDTKPVVNRGGRTSSVREACLVHIYPAGPAMGRRYPLGDRPVEIGRGDDCDIATADPSASRRHARLLPGPDGYRVVDLRSTNGTFVNDCQLDGPVALDDGDYLRVGNSIFRYLAGGNIEAEYHEEIYRLAIQDGLTRVSNRRALIDFLDREVTRSRRHGRPLSLLLLDIDHFKALNDRSGHLAGDQVLRDVADRVRPAVREEDLLARYGGEEFALVLVETPHDVAAGVAERVRDAVAARPFRLDGGDARVTVSVGVATTAGDAGLSVDDLLRLADARLYEAKRAGRDRVACGPAATAAGCGAPPSRRSSN